MSGFNRYMAVVWDCDWTEGSDRAGGGVHHKACPVSPWPLCAVRFSEEHGGGLCLKWGSSGSTCQLGLQKGGRRQWEVSRGFWVGLEPRDKMAASSCVCPSCSHVHRQGGPEDRRRHLTDSCDTGGRTGPGARDQK